MTCHGNATPKPDVLSGCANADRIFSVFHHPCVDFGIIVGQIVFGQGKCDGFLFSRSQIYLLERFQLFLRPLKTDVFSFRPI